MKKRWLIHHHDSQMVQQVEQRAGVSPVVAQLLTSRGVVDSEEIRTFLDAKLVELRDPVLLPGVEEAAKRILAAVRDNRRIVIYGDYDADGMTSTAILHECIRLIGGDVGYHVPNRLDDGYGLNCDAIEQLEKRGTSMIISVDCGIASIEPAKKARELGLELIVTDHHQFGDELPCADVLVHPALPGHHYPFAGLCGAGVAFKLAWAICQIDSESDKVKPTLRAFLLRALGLAAIGTIADVVPLVDENRILVRHGLKSLRHSPILGLDCLMRCVKLDSKPELSAEDVAFMLAPRLNAAGRLGQAQLGVELLITQSRERAESLAEYIHELNKSRDSLDRSIYIAANKQIKERFDPANDPALVLSGRGWHAGVIGIVAGRIAEKYNRPTVIITMDQAALKPAMGSARSACGVNLHQALEHCSDHLVSHGGHAAAAGLKIDEAQLEDFREEFCEYVESEVTETDKVPELNIDVESPLSLLTLNSLNELESLSPFGQGNPRPLFCAFGVEVAEPPKRMGGGERHLSIKLSQQGASLRGVAFGKGDWVEEIEQVTGPLDIVYRPVVNEFRGRRNVELHLVDWRPAEAAH